jgi:hypothetical protein
MLGQFLNIRHARPSLPVLDETLMVGWREHLLARWPE